MADPRDKDPLNLLGLNKLFSEFNHGFHIVGAALNTHITGSRGKKGQAAALLSHRPSLVLSDHHGMEHTLRAANMSTFKGSTRET